MLAHAHARRRRPRARVRVPYPAWFFLNRVTRVWVARSIPAPLSGSEPPRSELPHQRLSVNCRVGQAVGQLRRLNRTIATVQTEPLQLLDGFGPNCPSRSAINSAPFSHFKTHQLQKTLSLCVLNWEVKFCLEVTSNGKWKIQFLKRLPKEILQKFVLKEGSENSTDSLIKLLSESRTSEEEYSSTFLLPLQWVLLQSKGKYSSEICLCPAASIIL